MSEDDRTFALDGDRPRARRPRGNPWAAGKLAPLTKEFLHRKLYVEKVSREALAAELGCSTESIRATARRHGLGRLKAGRKQTLVPVGVPIPTPAYPNHEEMRGTYWRMVYRNAFIRHLAMTITQEEAWQVYLSQDRRCALSGRPIRFAATSKELVAGRQTASMDRIDSKRPYESGNIQWVHKDFQRMKNDLTNREFLERCREVVAHHGG